MAEGQGLIKQPLGLFNPAGFALARSSQLAAQVVEPCNGFSSLPASDSNEFFRLKGWHDGL